MNIDYEYDDTPCPKCNHAPTHWRDCDVCDCDDGWIDEHDDDPINFAPGEEYTMCYECHGTGILRWCPKCGFDLQRSIAKETA